MDGVIEEGFYDTARANAAKTGRRIERDLTDGEIRTLAGGQHIWLNAFSCIHPTDEFLADLGRAVLKYLNESEVVDDFVGLTKVTYVRINKS